MDTMEVEIIILATLIVLFIASFCGLLRKLRKTYERDRELTERVANLTSPSPSLTEVYVNPSFGGAENRTSEEGIFPGAPPPYSETYMEQPPKYEDVVKNENLPGLETPTSTC